MLLKLSKVGIYYKIDWHSVTDNHCNMSDRHTLYKVNEMEYIIVSCY